MKTYIVSYIAMLAAIATAFPVWNIQIYPTTHFYKDGNMVYVIDGRFIDSMHMLDVCGVQKTQNIDSLGITDSSIMIYSVNLNDSEVLK